jgi:hypothetical protein
MIRLEAVTLALFALIAWTHKHLDGLIDPVATPGTRQTLFNRIRRVLSKADGTDQK